MVIRVKNVKDGRFSIEFARTEQDDGFYTVHGNKIVTGSKGRFVSGPSFKGRDDKWVNQTWMDDKFTEYVIGLVDAAEPKAPLPQDGPVYDDDSSIPF